MYKRQERGWEGVRDKRGKWERKRAREREREVVRTRGRGRMGERECDYGHIHKFTIFYSTLDCNLQQYDYKYYPILLVT